jgi:hypothetical protein
MPRLERGTPVQAPPEKPYTENKFYQLVEKPLISWEMFCSQGKQAYTSMVQHMDYGDHQENFKMNDAQVAESLAGGESLADEESLVDSKNGDEVNSMGNEVKGTKDSEAAKNEADERNSAERRNGMDDLTAQTQALVLQTANGLYDVPSRRLSLLVEGRDYLKYRETFERLLFSEKMTPAHKDARILKLAMACLVEKMDAVSAATGEPFVKAEMLAG